MTRTIFCFLPFMVCLIWTATFLISSSKSNAAKKHLTLFLVVCTVLYFCHGLYFHNGPAHFWESLWSLCSLLAYPLYLGYIIRLTTSNLDRKYWIPVLAVPVTIALAKYVFPGDFVDALQKGIFLVQVIVVLVIGFRKLDSFNARLMEFYSNTEKRDTTPIKKLLAFFVATSILSSVANVLGRQFFGDSDILLYLISAGFSSMLFALSWIGYKRDFSVEQFTDEIEEISENQELSDEHHEYERIGNEIDRLLEVEQLYLDENITLNDLVRKVDSCRTYVSNYINNEKGVSFSDYINRLRIEHAKKLMIEQPGQKQIVISKMSGYSNEQSFYRNFRKFTGMTPSGWLRQNNNQ